MAENDINLDKPSFDFGIENTMEMGLGNAELLKDLMSPETSTTDPDEIETIVKEVKEPIIPDSSKQSQRGKEIVQKEEGEKLTDKDILSNFLGSDSEGEEEGEDKEEPVKETQKETAKDTGQVVDFAALSRDLKNLGVFSPAQEGEEDVDPNSPDEFLERFKSEKQRGAMEIVDKFLGRFGEDYQNAFEAIYVKGANPKEYFDTYNNIVSFIDLDLTQEDNQVRVLKQSLADQGWETEDITDEIERIKNNGDLESVSVKHHKVLVKREAQKLQEVEKKAEQELQQKNNIRNQYIQNIQQILQDKLKTKEFDGIPINPKLVSELQDFLLVDKYRTPSGETLTDFDKTILELKRPENHAMKAKIGLILKILEKDPTLSTIQKMGMSKKSDQLFGEVTRQVASTKNTSSAQQSNRSWFSQ